MKRSFVLFLLSLVFCSCSLEKKNETKIVSIKSESLKTLKVLTESLYHLQIAERHDDDFGAIKCPECGVLHTRAAEAVYPFAVMYQQSSDGKYLQAAIQVGNWLIKQQLAEGEWKETPWEWTGTTADQLLMMANAYPIVKEHLSDAEKRQWKNSIKAAADYLVKYMSPDFASINYCPTSAAALAITFNLIADERYAEKAKKLARWTVAKMDEDGFIQGEAARVLGVKYGVDLGYEMDMSLWGLTVYAKNRNDRFVLDAVRKSLKKNLYFVYPNGAIDGSWGSRCYKWTTYGSKTADGPQILFSLFADEDTRYATAAMRNLEYLQGMMQDGLIGNGPQYFELFNNKPCIYPTFARAKNLAMTVAMGKDKQYPLPPLPADETGWVKYYPTVNVALVRSKNFMTTISAYGYRDITNWGQGKYTHRPSGGSMCNLWVEGFGYLQSSSQTRYVRGEVMHMPEVSDSLVALTPRIEFHDENGYFSNLYECEGSFTVHKGEQAVATVSTVGELKNEKYIPSGVAYKWTHLIHENFVEKEVTLRFHDRWPVVQIIEPVINWQGSQFEQTDEKNVLINSKGRQFSFQLLAGNAILTAGKDVKHCWMPFPSLKAYPIVLEIIPANEKYVETVRYRITLTK